MKKEVAKLIAKKTKKDYKKIFDLIEIPPEDSFGDYSFPCFSLAREQKRDPMDIAKKISEEINKKLPRSISHVSAVKGYVNFFVNKKMLVRNVLNKAMSDDFGQNKSGKGRKIVIDMSSPNIAKPFGIGHLRSTIIGNSLAKIAEANGYRPIKINYLGDWGTQFGRIILGWKKWGSEKELEKNAINHLYSLYVRAGEENYSEQAREEFNKLENGDKENLALWKRFRKISIREFNKIYRFLGIRFNEISGESKYNDKLNNVVELLKQKKLLKKDRGAMIVDLKKYNLGIALIQKSDGTSLYATRDIAAAIDRYNQYKFSKLIYEVGYEQKLHFKQVFKILELLRYPWAENCIHISHGLYLGRDGKKFASRSGRTVFMQDVLDEVIEKAKNSILDREKVAKEELDRRAHKIAIAAIFYGDLKNYRENNIIFDIDKFLEFEGDTGPYLLYSYARANSITRKRKLKELKVGDLDNPEIRLVKKIANFPGIVKKAYDSFSPNLIANYSYELAKAFNEFYHSCPVLGSEKQDFRLIIVEAFKKTLKKSLDLLGIGVLEKM